MGNGTEEVKALKERASRHPFREEVVSLRGGELGCAVGTLLPPSSGSDSQVNGDARFSREPGVTLLYGSPNLIGSNRVKRVPNVP